MTMKTVTKSNEGTGNWDQGYAWDCCSMWHAGKLRNSETEKLGNSIALKTLRQIDLHSESKSKSKAKQMANKAKLHQLTNEMAQTMC